MWGGESNEMERCGLRPLQQQAARSQNFSNLSYNHCSNLGGSRIPSITSEPSPKSESILMANSETQQDSDFKVKGRLSLQLPKISSPSLDNYAGVLAGVFVLGILNAG